MNVKHKLRVLYHIHPESQGQTGGEEERRGEEEGKEEERRAKRQRSG